MDSGIPAWILVLNIPLLAIRLPRKPPLAILRPVFLRNLRATGLPLSRCPALRTPAATEKRFRQVTSRGAHCQRVST
jgi:hypothetical protein